MTNEYNPEDEAVSFDLSNNASGEGRKVLPKGLYRTFISNVESKQSKSGNPMWKVTLDVIEPAQYAGAKLFDNLVWTAKAENMVMRRLLAAGFNVQPGARINMRPSELLNKRVTVQVKHREYNGSLQTDVSDWTHDSGPMQQQGSSQGAGQQQTPAPQQPPQSQQGQMQDFQGTSDIPF